MRAVVQRVRAARVLVDEMLAGSIGAGLLVYCGYSKRDTAIDLSYMYEKILNLRIFPDQAGVMNRSLYEEGLEILLISQFTLYGDARKGRRPSYSSAAAPDIGRTLHERFIGFFCDGIPGKVQTGRFQTDMLVLSEGSGPVTILLDSEKTF